MIRRSLWVYISIKPILPTHIFCPYFSFCIFNCSSGPLWELLAMRIICLHNPRDILNLISFFTLFTASSCLLFNFRVHDLWCLLLLITTTYQSFPNTFKCLFPFSSLHISVFSMLAPVLLNIVGEKNEYLAMLCHYPRIIINFTTRLWNL